MLETLNVNIQIQIKIFFCKYCSYNILSDLYYDSPKLHKFNTQKCYLLNKIWSNL